MNDSMTCVFLSGRLLSFESTWHWALFLTFPSRIPCGRDTKLNLYEAPIVHHDSLTFDKIVLTSSFLIACAKESGAFRRSFISLSFRSIVYLYKRETTTTTLEYSGKQSASAGVHVLICAPHAISCLNLPVTCSTELFIPFHSCVFMRQRGFKYNSYMSNCAW